MKSIAPTRWSEGRPVEARVTVCTPVVARPEAAKTCLASLKRYADFPSRFKVLMHPDLGELARWASEGGFEVWRGFLTPIIAAKSWLVSGCETEFCLLQDCDWEAATDYAPLLEAMDEDPGLASISPLMERPYGPDSTLRGALLGLNPIRVMELKKGRAERIEPGRPLYHVDYSSISSILIRMEAYRERPFDTEYGYGYAHEDWFLQLLGTKWRKAIHRRVTARMIDVPGPEWYRRMRFDKESIARSKRRFVDKWGRK